MYKNLITRSDDELDILRVNASTISQLRCVAAELSRRNRSRMAVIKSAANNIAKYIEHSNNTADPAVDDTVQDAEELNSLGYWCVVKFDGNAYKQYTYKSVRPVKRGDRVLVISPYNGLTAVTVVDDSRPITDAEKTFMYKWTLRYRDDPEHKERTRLDVAAASAFEDAEKKRLAAQQVEEKKQALSKQLERLTKDRNRIAKELTMLEMNNL